MSNFRIHLEKVWRRRWLVIAITLVAFGSSLAWTLTQPTTYTASWALSGASQERSPESDTVLAQGYVELFNEPNYQTAMRNDLGIAGDIELHARIIGTSPIVYIEATATSADVAKTTTGAVATKFREDIRANLMSLQEPIVSGLYEQIAVETARLQTLTPGSDVHTVTEALIRSLQDRALEVDTDLTNQLRNLQLESSIGTNAPDPVINGALGLVGGLLLGVLAAVVLGSLGWRLTTPDDVHEKLGLDTLAVIDARSGSSAPQLQRLANLVSLTTTERPATLAVTAVRGTPLNSQLALGLASNLRVRGERTVLLQADLWSHTAEAQPGLTDLLQRRPAIGPRARPAPHPRHDLSMAELLVPGPGGLALLPSGSSPTDPFALFEPERFVEAVHQATQYGDIVVIDAPPVCDAPEASVACAAADAAIVLVEMGVTRTSDAVQACETLARLHVRVLGVVICGSLHDLDSVLSDLPETPLAAVSRRHAANGVVPQEWLDKSSAPRHEVVSGEPARHD